MPLTQEQYGALPAGTKVKVVANIGGHSYALNDGAVYRLFRRSGPNWLLSRSDETALRDAAGGYVRYDEVILVGVTRNAKIKELKKAKEEAEAKLIKIAHELEVATKFKNELDELAFAIFTASAGEKTSHKFFYETLKKLGVAEDIVRTPGMAAEKVAQA